MKCPHCGLIVTDQVPQCRGCGFTLGDLERQLPRVPARTGFVNDFATVLTSDEKADLEERLAQFQQAQGGEIVLVTINSAAPIKPAEYVFYLFNRWQVGGETHSGLMLLLAMKEHRVECEVGYSWEDIISDVESAAVLDEHVIPALKAGKIGEALRAGVEQLAGIIEQFAADPITEPVAEGGAGR